MDVQTSKAQGKLLPRQPDMQAETRAAGSKLNHFTNACAEPNGNIGQIVQQLIQQLVQLLLAQLKSHGQNPKPIDPPDIQPVYGVVVPPDDGQVQPVYGVVIDPGPIKAVYGAPQDLT